MRAYREMSGSRKRPGAEPGADGGVIGSYTDGSPEADAGEGTVYRGGGASGWRWDHEAPDHPDKGWWTLVDGIYRF